MAPPYSHFARYYDRIVGYSGLRTFGPAYCAQIEALPPQRALDVACGTGLWARHLARELGWEVVGADRSEAMLSRARRRCAGLRVSFVSTGMPALSAVAAPFGLVTCTNDSLNYLPDGGSLEVALGRFHDLLEPGGLAVFDANTTVALRDKWGTAEIVRRAGAAVCVMSTQWSRRERKNTLTVELFVPRRGTADTFHRHVERHVERALDVDEVVSAARRAGFDSVNASDLTTGGEPARGSAKILYRARR